MPSRPVIALFLLGWACSLCWFVSRDFLPRLRSDEAPLYVINVTDEVSQKLPPGWRALRTVDDVACRYEPRARVRYDEQHDEHVFRFTLIAFVNNFEKHPELYHLARVSSTYRISREGRMNSFRVVTVHVVDLFGILQHELVTVLEGRANGASITVRWQHDGEHGDVETVTMSYPRRALLPLHPLPQIKDLRPGQRWREPMIPLLHEGPFLALAKPTALQWVEAEVLPEDVVLRWRGDRVSCRIVEYRQGERTILRTWVELSGKSDVLRYELRLPDETWVIDRTR